MVDEKISVCMATYNGDQYIKQQIESILIQLKEYDELIISDDGSTDDTLKIISSFNDHRIKIYNNENRKGVVGNFENAIMKCSGDIIFLSDQDDVWRDDKVKVISDFFKKKPSHTCVFSNAIIIDKNGNSLSEVAFKREPDIDLLKVLIRNKFLGCTMAFRSNIKTLPFPNKLPMHDWYIGLRHICKGKVGFINENLIFYRRHGNNVTTGKRSNFLQVLVWRIEILKSLFIN